MANTYETPYSSAQLQQQAQIAAQLAAHTSLANVAQQRTADLREYGWAKGEVDPQYNRLVAEQAANLAKTMANSQYSRDTSNQDYDISSRNLGDQLSEQLKRTETDMARRGLWQSGLLSQANLGLQGKYITSQGDIERSRYNRMAQINSLSDAAQQQATFNLSDAQRARVAQLQKLLEAYQGQLTDLNTKQQSIADQQGLSTQDLYNKLMQQNVTNTINERQQGLAEQQFHHDAYWAKANADEARRQYDIAQAQAAAQRKAQGLNY